MLPMLYQHDVGSHALTNPSGERLGLPYSYSAARDVLA